MDTLQEIIHTMDAVQHKEFVYFIQRNKYRKGRKDLQLFSILKEEMERKPAVVVKLLGCPNTNAYHTIRKRLFQHLADYFILKSISDDATSYSHVNGVIGVVNYLFDKGLMEQGWKYLLLAEDIATQNNYHTLLNTIYLLQIDKIHLQNDVNLNAIISKYKKNKEVLIQEENLQIASGMIRQKLNENKGEGADKNFDKLIKATLSNLNINNAVLKTPNISLNFIKIIRTGIMAKKDFYQFEPYLIETYTKLYEGRTTVNHTVKAEFLYIIAHTSYRNKNFEQSLKSLDELSATLNECGKAFQKQYSARRLLLVSANLVFLKKLKEAIDNLMILYKQKNRLSNADHFNTIVNLGIYRFFNKEYKKSQALLTELSHSDNWYRKTMGAEWVLKKNLMEILLFIELKHYDLAESRIKSIERNFTKLKTHPVYKKAFLYLKLLRDYIYKYMENVSGFREEIWNQLEFVPYEQEDIQAMAFYAWIKSKTTKEDFYATLLGLIKS